MRNVDRAHWLLRTLGWSYGDLRHSDGEGPAWIVYAHRDEHRIVVHAPSQAAAWDETLRQAAIVQRE